MHIWSRLGLDLKGLVHFPAQQEHVYNEQYSRNVTEKMHLLARERK